MSPQYEQISVSEIVSRCKVQLKLTNTSDYDSYLEMMIFEGMTSLGVLSQLVKKQCPLSITCGAAKLPKDFIKLIAVKADMSNNDPSNDPIANQVVQSGLILYADMPFLKSFGFDNFGLGFAFNVLQFPFQSFQINKGYIHFNAPNISVNNASIAYYGLNIDEDGKEIIFSRYERALANYAMWMFALTNFGDYNQYIIEKYESIWKAQKGMLMARDVRFSFENEKREIQNILGAMVVSKAINFINP